MTWVWVALGAVFVLALAQFWAVGRALGFLHDRIEALEKQDVSRLVSTQEIAIDRGSKLMALLDEKIQQEQ